MSQLPQHPTQPRPKMSKYWRSPEELDPSAAPDATGEFLSSPIREGAADDDAPESESRREFLTLMGASIAMMGASACTRRPTERIVPYFNKPASVTPGVA